MSIAQLLDFIPEQRRKTVHHEQDGRFWIESRQDVEPVIENAKMLSMEKPNKDFTRVALIPLSVLNEAFTEGWFDDPDAWKKWANDPTNACYRTTKGTI
jgi:hypothetical protein